ncbi:MAG: Archaeal fructose-1,6-bisphosphatase and related enzymes of inositol monophosphatase family [Rhodobacteraceae bacterium HLUCCA08]|nr:MAG: Archaeal fructose-1,6-bisphosphatase and related enzymes of inositol monophosphatase family [Rhodobacteraceae bacterium HLUCCA08]
MGLSETERDGLIGAVRAAARTQIMPRFRRLTPEDIDTKTSPSDLVTVADRAAEIMLHDAVRVLMPDAAIVGEEAVSDDPTILDRLKRGGRTVLIDPIDGTWNYAAGLAVFGVILAVVEDGETSFGLLYDPVMDDWVMAGRGQGAWFCRPEGTALRLQGPPPRPKADAHAFVPLFLYPPSERARLAARLPGWGRVTSLRCSCHEYRTLAFGHADLIAAPAPKPWDHAAGVLIAGETGGSAWSGKPGYDLTDSKATLVVKGRAPVNPGWASDFE